MNKRGISPLVSTILLLVFAIGLGVIVMSWGRAQVEAASKCAINTGLNVIELNGLPEVCSAGSGDKGYIHFIVENGPNIDIATLQMSVIGTKKIFNTEIQEEIQMGYSLMKDLPYDFDIFGNIRQIKFTPKVILYPEEDPILCPEQSIIISEVRKC